MSVLTGAALALKLACPLGSLVARTSSDHRQVFQMHQRRRATIDILTDFAREDWTRHGQDFHQVSIFTSLDTNM